MSVFVTKAALAYFPVPKVACTSLKLMFFEIENGFPFRAYRANNNDIHIHNVLPSKLFTYGATPRIADFHKITVLRDPVARLLSCYTNRVVHHRELAAAQLSPEMQKAGAIPDPDLDTFVDRLDLYRRASKSIWHHTDPLCAFLGPDPGYFDRLYRMRELDQLKADLSARLDRALILEKSQSSGKKLRESDLNAAQIARLKKFYAEDYDIWGAFL